jgi:hypothetical protein
MAYQRGSLKKVRRREGDTWVLRYRVASADGRRVEHTTPIGLVQKFPKDEDAWREIDRLGILIRINDNNAPSRIRFNSLAEHYLKADFGADAVRPKSENTTGITEHIVRDYLIARWGEEIAEDIKPLEIQRWLKSLNTESRLAWTTIAKMRGVMSRIYKVGILHEQVNKNPVMHVESRCKSNYRAIVITPTQTFNILKSLRSNLHHTLVLTCAATALRSSEIFALSIALFMHISIMGAGLSRVVVVAAEDEGESVVKAAPGFANPKSRSFAPVDVNITLPGLRSR